jgi:hypothetical protein
VTTTSVIGADRGIAGAGVAVSEARGHPALADNLREGSEVGIAASSMGSMGDHGSGLPPGAEAST